MIDSLQAELYLRVTAERALLEGDIHQFGWPVPSAAAALLAVEAIGPEVAAEVAGDFGLACLLRGRRGPAFFPQQVARGGHPPAASARRHPRVVACKTAFDGPVARLKFHYVILGDDLTMLRFTAILHSGQAVPGAPQLQLTDDQGTTVTAPCGPAGGGGQGGFEVVATAQVPLSRTTRWIDVGADRIDLSENDSGPEVRLENVPRSDPALAHLWRRLATSRGPMLDGSDLEVAIDALVAVGALDPASPELRQVREVADVISAAFHPAMAAVPAGRPSPSGLPEPWASLAATQSRPRKAGPTATMFVGAVTPSIDGITVIAEDLTSQPDGFTVNVATTPGSGLGGLVSPAPLGPGGPLAWWAEDDRGGVYLGATTNWGGGPDHARGTVQFAPAIDPHCRELRLLPTGETQRAVVPVALRWGDQK
jgi:hypothetical protein